MADSLSIPTQEEINDSIFEGLMYNSGASNMPEPSDDMTDETYASSLDAWKFDAKREMVKADPYLFESHFEAIESRLDNAIKYQNRLKSNKDIGAARDVVNRVGGGLLNHVIGDTLSVADFLIDVGGGDSNMGAGFYEQVEGMLPTNPKNDGSMLAVGIDAATQAASFAVGPAAGKLATMGTKYGKVGGAIKWGGRKLPLAQMVGLGQREARAAYDKVLTETGDEDKASSEYVKNLGINLGAGAIPIASLNRIMKKGAMAADEAGEFATKSYFNSKDFLNLGKAELGEEILQTAFSNASMDYTLRGENSGLDAIGASLIDEENLKELAMSGFGGFVGGVGSGATTQAIFNSDFNKAVRTKRAKVMNDAYKAKDDFYVEAGKDGDFIVKHRLADIKDIDRTLEAYNEFVNDGGVGQKQIDIAVEEMNILKGMKEELITQFRQKAKDEGREPEFNDYLARQGIVIEEGSTVEEANTQEAKAVTALETEQANLEQIDQGIEEVDIETLEAKEELKSLKNLSKVLKGSTTEQGVEMGDVETENRVGVELARLRQDKGKLEGELLAVEANKPRGWKEKAKKLKTDIKKKGSQIKLLDNSNSLVKKRETVNTKIAELTDFISQKKVERNTLITGVPPVTTKTNLKTEPVDVAAQERVSRQETINRITKAQENLETVRAELDTVFNKDAEGKRVKAFIKVGSGRGTANFSNKLSDDVKKYTTGLLSGLQNDTDVTVLAKSDLNSPRVATILGLDKKGADSLIKQAKGQRAMYFPSSNAIVFDDNIDLSDRGATTIGHEIGHSIVENAIAKSPQLRETLEAAYSRFIKDQTNNVKDKTINTASASQVAVEPSRLEEVDRVEEGLDVSNRIDTYLAARNRPRSTDSVDGVNRPLSFNEYLAQQVNKAMQTKMPDTPLGKFFNDLADAIKALYARVKLKAPKTAEVDPTINDFVNSIFDSAAQKAALEQFGRTASDKGPGNAPQGDSTTGPTDTKGGTETKAETSKSAFFKEPRNKVSAEDAEFMNQSLKDEGLAEENLRRPSTKEAQPEDIENPEDFIEFLGDLFRPEGEQRRNDNKLKETILGSDAFSKEAKAYTRKHADDDHEVISQKETIENALAYIKTFGIDKAEDVFFDDNIAKPDGFGVALGDSLARVLDKSASLAKKQGLLKEAANLRSRSNEVLLKLSNQVATSAGRGVSMFSIMKHANSPTSIRYLLNRTIKRMAKDTGDKDFKLTEETSSKLDSLAEELLRAKDLNSPFLQNRAVGEMATTLIQDTKLYQADRLINWVYMNMLNGLNTTIGVNPFGNLSRFLAVTLPTILTNKGFAATAMQSLKDALKYTPQEAYNIFLYGESPESTDLSKLNISQSQEDILSKVRKKIQELTSKEDRTLGESVELYANKYFFHPLENLNNLASFRALQSVDFLFYASNEMIYRQGLMAAELLKGNPKLTFNELATAVSTQLYGKDENGERGTYESNKDKAIANIKEVMKADKFAALAPAERKRLVHKEMFSIAANNTSPQIKSLAEQFAAESTFTQNPTGILGRASEMLERFMRNGTKKMRSDDFTERMLGYAQVATRMALFPFNRVVFNVTNDLLNFTPIIPIGAIRAGAVINGKQYFGTETRYDATKGRETVELSDLKKQQLRTQSAIGTVVPIVLTSIIASEWDLPEEEKTISFYGDLQGASPARKRQLKEAGITPYSLKMGSFVFSFKDTVLRIPLGVIGDMSDAVRFGTRKVPWNLLDGVEQGKSVKLRDLSNADQAAVLSKPEFWIDPILNATGGFMASFGDTSPLGGIGGLSAAIGATRFGGFKDIPTAVADSTASQLGRTMPWNAPLLRDVKSFTGDYVIDRDETSEAFGMEFPNPATYFLGNTPFAGGLDATRPAVNVFGDPITEKLFITNRISRTFPQNPDFEWLGKHQIALTEGSSVVSIKLPGRLNKNDAAEFEKIYSERAMDEKIINVAKGNLNDEEGYEFRTKYIGPKLKEIVKAFEKNTNPEVNKQDVVKELNKRVAAATSILKQQFLDDKYGTKLVEEKDRIKLKGLTEFD